MPDDFKAAAPDNAIALTREAILIAFWTELNVHASHLPEVEPAKIDVSFGPPHPTKSRPYPQPTTPGERHWPALVIETSYPPKHSGPVSTCRQFIPGDRVASLLDCDLVSVDERQLVRSAVFEEPLLSMADAGKLLPHLRANEQGCAKCLELMQQVAAICTVPNQTTAVEFEAQVAFAWTANL